MSTAYFGGNGGTHFDESGGGRVKELFVKWGGCGHIDSISVNYEIRGLVRKISAIFFQKFSCG